MTKKGSITIRILHKSKTHELFLLSLSKNGCQIKNLCCPTALSISNNYEVIHSRWKCTSLYTLEIICSGENCISLYKIESTSELCSTTQIKGFIHLDIYLVTRAKCKRTQFIYTLFRLESFNCIYPINIPLYNSLRLRIYTSTKYSIRFRVDSAASIE